MRHNDAAFIPGMGPGETAALSLAGELRASLILMDDRRGVAEAVERGFAVTGTLGLLSLAAKQEILNLAAAFDLLKQTNFRCRQETMDLLLAESEQP